MTTGKIIVLTRQTFVGKVMSLLFNMLSEKTDCRPTVGALHRGSTECAMRARLPRPSYSVQYPAEGLAYGKLWRDESASRMNMLLCKL